jgi:hypothetical protein
MSYESARAVAVVVAGMWMLIGIPLGLYSLVRALPHLIALQRMRQRRVKASDPDPVLVTEDERAHLRTLLREGDRFLLCIAPPVLLAILFDLG